MNGGEKATDLFLCLENANCSTGILGTVLILVQGVVFQNVCNKGSTICFGQTTE